ncbi:MAG: putative heme transporter [Solirubrobacteraceae bacterium]|nr:putative heme transporter [Solirubrobacteraceae bacterium]
MGVATARQPDLPSEFDTRRLARRALQVIALLALVVLAAALAPGLGALRDEVRHVAPAWVLLAVLFELLSCLSYVLMFRPIFCRTMSWRSANEIGWSELGMGSIVPASGIGGLALGAWVLHRGGMDPGRIARRSIAFFLIKSSVNFAAVVVLGVVMWLGVGPHESVWLTLVPAVMAALVIALMVTIPQFGPGATPPSDAGKVRRALAKARTALVDGTSEALEILRHRELAVIAGAVGYWIFDNAVLWATFHAFGSSPPLTVVLMGYLIGQLGGLLPIPGGLGGIDGGLIGTLVVYGAPAAATAAAVLLYRVILFWLPLIGGSVAFFSLRRALGRPDRPDLCLEVPVEPAKGGLATSPHPGARQVL